jgi:hypothetical protein
MGSSTSAFVVVAYRLLLPGCRMFAACSPACPASLVLSSGCGRVRRRVVCDRTAPRGRTTGKGVHSPLG